MKWKIFAVLSCIVVQLAAAENTLMPVFQDSDHQFTGVAISKTGRLFVNYPRWQEAHRFDVAEISPDGTVRPYPDAAWNQWNENQSASNHWVCVQAVYVDEGNDLWVVDPAAPGMNKVEEYGAKVVSIDLQSNRVTRIYDLTAVVGRNSYLNDIRVDILAQTAYLTESKNGGIVVLDLVSGDARLVLAKTKVTRTSPKHALTIDGKPLLRDGKPFKVNSDGIALSPDREWLYFKPLSDTTLYRVRTADLRDPNLSKRQLLKRVEFLGDHFTVSDGMIFDPAGNLYLGDLEHNALMRITPDLKLETLVQDPRLLWPDTFSLSPDGWLYVSCSQIQNMPWCHDGKSTRTTPYSVYKIKLP